MTTADAITFVRKKYSPQLDAWSDSTLLLLLYSDLEKDFQSWDSARQKQEQLDFLSACYDEVTNNARALFESRVKERDRETVMEDYIARMEEAPIAFKSAEPQTFIYFNDMVMVLRLRSPDRIIMILNQIYNSIEKEIQEAETINNKLARLMVLNEIKTKISTLLTEDSKQYYHPEIIKYINKLRPVLVSYQENINQIIEINDPDPNTLKDDIKSDYQDKIDNVLQSTVDTPTPVPSEPSNTADATPDKGRNSRKKSIQKTTLLECFEHVSKYNTIMELLVTHQFCQAGTYIWIYASRGTVAILIKYLHSMGFYEGNTHPSSEEVLLIAKETFGVEIGIDTVKHAKVPTGPTHNLSFIKSASTY